MTENKNKENKTEDKPETNDGSGNTDTKTGNPPTPNNPDAKEAKQKQPNQAADQTTDKNIPETNTATPAEPKETQTAPTEKPKPEPVKRLTKLERDIVRLTEEFEFYKEAVDKYESEKAIRRFYNILEFLKKNATDDNINHFFKMVAENKKKLLHENVTMAGISSFSLQQNNSIIIAHKLFKDLLEPKKVKPNVRSAKAVKEAVGEKLFNWFNKKYPKNTFV